jgi:hypothetical protein
MCDGGSTERGKIRRRKKQGALRKLAIAKL